MAMKPITLPAIGILSKKTESKRMVDEVRHQLCHHDDDRGQGRGKQYLHRSHLLLLDDGDTRHHGTNQEQNQADYTRHEVVLTSALRIVEHFCDWDDLV